MSSRSHHIDDTAQGAARLCAAALAKIRSGDHDAVAQLIDTARATPDHDAITNGMLDAARCLAHTWAQLREDTAQRERALVHSKARARELADELVRILSMAQAGGASHEAVRNADDQWAQPLTGSQRATGTAAGSERNEPADDDPAPQCVVSVRVQVLAPFRVVVNDQPIDDWPNGKTKAILKYLLLHRQRPVAREALMELFWPDLDPEAARNNLNVAIHRLRRTLARGGSDPAFVLFADGHYVLNPRFAVCTDADEFSEAFSRAVCQEAAGFPDEAAKSLMCCAELYQTELLAEDRYETWIESPRQQLRDTYLDALGRLCRYYLMREQYAACNAMCVKILAVDGCNEEAHRMLMRCYARMSQPHLATQQYQACVRSLARELGISPSAETVSVYREIAQCALM